MHDSISMLSLAGRTLRFYSAVLATIVGIGLLLAHYRYVLDARHVWSAPHDPEVKESSDQPPKEPPFGAVVAAGRDSTDLTWTDHMKPE